MAALVTAGPILITPTYQRSTAFSINSFAFKVGQRMYEVLAPNRGPNAAIVITDATGNSVEQDPANAPSPDGDIYGAIYNPSNGMIYYAFPTGAQTFAIASFNTTTNLYGPTSSDSHAAIRSSSNKGVVICQKSDGTLVAFLAAASNPGPIRYLTLPTISGSWSSLTDLTGPINGSYLTGVVIDSSDRMHLVYDPDNTTDDINYILISSTFVPGSPITIDTIYDQVQTSQLIWDNKIVIAITGGAGSDDNILKVFIGTPLSGPTFTTYTVITVPNTEFINWATLAIDNAGNLVVFGAHYNYISMPIVDELLMWTFDGVSSWGSPVLFYDEVGNPPPNNVTEDTQFIHTGGAVQLNTGEWLYSTALEVFVEPAHLETCAGFVLITGDIALTVACPVGGGTGTLGSAYNKTLVGSGGTGILTYQLLSGSLPAGLTFNPATGNISGTIMGAGTYSPVYTVTDSLGNISDPTTCPIVIAGSNRPARKCVPQT